METARPTRSIRLPETGRGQNSSKQIHNQNSALADNRKSNPKFNHQQTQHLINRKWKKTKGTRERLGALYNEEFTSPPQLLSLSTLQYVEVRQSPRLATMLHELLTELGFKQIDSGVEYLSIVRENPNLPES